MAKANPDNDREEVERRSQLAKFVSHLAPLPRQRPTLYRSLEDIGMRSLALAGKGKLARALDKAQDSQEIIKLVEELRQAILVYQVSSRGRGSHSRVSLTRGTGVTATVDIQPGRPIECKFLPLIFDFETKLAVGRFKSSFDALLKLHQVRGRVRSCNKRHRTMHSQKTPVKNKIESVRARLDRLAVEGSATGDADELRRRTSLFGCVFSVCRERLLKLT